MTILVVRLSATIAIVKKEFRRHPVIPATACRWTRTGRGDYDDRLRYCIRGRQGEEYVSERLISLRGVEVHNLQGIDLDLPHRQLIVFCGVSGSGKSSLAFDTIYAEGQRRYIESFSAYTRQFLERLEKPAAQRIDGISPAIAVAASTSARSSRSTVGTSTEAYDYLRLLLARDWPGFLPAMRTRSVTAHAAKRGRGFGEAAGGNAVYGRVSLAALGVGRARRPGGADRRRRIRPRGLQCGQIVELANLAAQGRG